MARGSYGLLLGSETGRTLPREVRKIRLWNSLTWLRASPAVFSRYQPPGFEGTLCVRSDVTMRTA
jgi:hypothetical protein